MSAGEKSDPTNISNDLAYVRAVAEEGRNAPLTGGLMFVWWGSVIAIGALLQYVSDMGWVAFPISTIARWLCVFALGWGLGHFVFVKKVSKIPGSSTFGNQTATAAWVGVGIFMTVYFLSLVGAYFVMGENNRVIAYMFASLFPVTFGLYGVTYLVTSVAVNQSWMRAVSGVSFFFMVLMVFSITTPHNMLLAMFGVIAVAILPGLKMMKDQPSEIV